MISDNINNVINTSKHKIIIIDNADLILDVTQRVKMSMDTNNQYIVFIHNIDGFKPIDKSIAELEVTNNVGKLVYPLL
jgi:hypothetical protein